MKEFKCAQNSPEWFTYRAGKPTASMFGSVINEKSLLKDEIIEKLKGFEQSTPFKKFKVPELIEIANSMEVDISPNLVLAQTDYAEVLAAESLGGWDVDNWLPDMETIHTKHGKESELHAIKHYQDETDKNCFQVGFVTDDNENYGCSPDQFVDSDGLLEIKSPLAKNLIKYWMEYKETGQCPKDFKLQIQGQLMITEREWCDLILYHPVIEPKIIRVLPDLFIHKKLKEAIGDLISRRDFIISEMAGF